MSLEGLIEFVHPKELVQQARENIRREIENNHQAAQQNVVYLKENQTKVQAGLDTLHFMRKPFPESANKNAYVRYNGSR